ncbi:MULTISPECIES: hypothetical protein [unclassified Gemella]|uniref:hypothetical protein n=1 Tax=unclassified Gemella TaxID=2624949 RepID=UPI001C059A4D|nr:MULTISPECIES: hypothetical protein [unclassified Gemella]MBU0279222.1 hypothetical protein [Gemella sp. zg-1178]QWQ39327.1 hypothetical protein KMP11_03090 [Gemella sp. zg-570]
MKLRHFRLKLSNFLKGGGAMMINYFAMQVELGWITINQVPKKWRAKVSELLEKSNLGNKEA